MVTNSEGGFVKEDRVIVPSGQLFVILEYDISDADIRDRVIGYVDTEEEAIRMVNQLVSEENLVWDEYVWKLHDRILRYFDHKLDLSYLHNPDEYDESVMEEYHRNVKHFEERILERYPNKVWWNPGMIHHRYQPVNKLILKKIDDTNRIAPKGK